jgi:hypothetical protein
MWPGGDTSYLFHLLQVGRRLKPSQTETPVVRASHPAHEASQGTCWAPTGRRYLSTALPKLIELKGRKGISVLPTPSIGNERHRQTLYTNMRNMKAPGSSPS